MKRWLERHGKWIIVAIGLTFILFSGIAIATSEQDWVVALNILVIVAWAGMLLVVSGIMTKLFEWWEQD